ncbi:eCIS core domain-containing protein [Nostoc sp.]|uniref:eCIS core domain-containing protein n=1 Tax=Nostoc sp. TaxID=1180 RepID=UPI002FF7C4B5
MHNKRLSKTPSSINSNSQAAEQNPKLAYRPFGSQIQKASVAPVTQSTKEDVAFAEQKMEAFGLELQAKYGKITPEGQERLTVLQAKMASFSSSQLEHARRYSHNIANIPLRRPDIPIQAKLTIGEPGDKYEQEADETARQVVQRIHQPQSEKLQRESLPDEEELQMKPMVQRVSDGGMAATQDLEASINQARGGGQPLAKNIREPMEQGFGADFSRVKVHTDTQSDQLNRAIQAKAFTTGQDVFFRQGAYEPGSLGGQELLAHELTHVVQQNGGRVQRTGSEQGELQTKKSPSALTQSDPANVSYRLTVAQNKAQSGRLNPSKSIPSISRPEHTIQRTIDKDNVTRLSDINALNTALFNLTPQITGISLDMLETPGATLAMLNMVINQNTDVLYNSMKRSEVLTFLKPALEQTVDTKVPHYVYDTHGDKHFQGGPQGTKFQGDSQAVNPKLENLITSEIGRIRRHANGRDENYYYTLAGVAECRGMDLTIQLTYSAASDTVNYHGYPDNSVIKHRLSDTKGGEPIP